MVFVLGKVKLRKIAAFPPGMNRNATPMAKRMAAWIRAVFKSVTT